jgi:hypothetical protein
MKQNKLFIGILIGLVFTIITGVTAETIVSRTIEDEKLRIIAKEKITEKEFNDLAIIEKVKKYQEIELNDLHVQFKELMDYCFSNNGQYLQYCVTALENTKREYPFVAMIPPVVE